MADPVLPGAEPLSVAGAPLGALVLHGFTGNPSSMRSIAQQLAAAGLSVELPRLPGHGTSVEDLATTTFADWSGAADAAYGALAAHCERVAVVGMSVGGGLACWLAEHHPEVAGLALINPMVEPAAAEVRELLAGMQEAGETVAPGVGSDIALPGAVESAYGEIPLTAAASLFDGMEQVAAELGAVRCPVLLLSSREDHVVPPSNGDRVVDAVTGPVERVWLERSYHVATLDHDRAEVEARTVAFVLGALGDGA